MRGIGFAILYHALPTEIHETTGDPKLDYIHQILLKIVRIILFFTAIVCLSYGD
jgi:hypothetical protein